MIVGVDLDGVVADIHSVALRLFNEKYNDTAVYEDINTWGAVIHGKDFVPFIFKSIENEELHKTLSVVAGAKEALDQIGRRHKIVIATSRPKTPDQWILDWLKNNEIKFDYMLNFGHAEKNLLRAYMLIDDYPVNFEGFQGIKLLFDRPWNRDNTQLHRVMGWEEIIPTLLYD